jgi:hypothetical protein
MQPREQITSQHAVNQPVETALPIVQQSDKLTFLTLPERAKNMVQDLFQKEVSGLLVAHTVGIAHDDPQLARYIKGELTREMLSDICAAQVANRVTMLKDTDTPKALAELT